MAAAAERAERAGLRPEAPLADRATGDSVRDAIVAHVEFLGHETLAHVRLPPRRRLPLVAVGRHARTASAERVRLSVDLQRLHLFGADGRTRA
jgi:ABC-type sugar transport system ATPase subunit